MDNRILYKIDDSDDDFQMPEECEESEKVIKSLEKENLEAQYDFIDMIVLAFVILAAATVFIAMTSSKKYGDEGNKFSLERLCSGKYTAEMESRYESTLPFPQQIKWLEERISLIYGIGNKVSDPVDMIDEDVSDTHNSFDIDRGEGHDEHAVTTASAEDEKTTEKASGTTTKKTAAVYKTTFVRTTPDDESETETTTTKKTTTGTTTNNIAPVVTITTTVPPASKPVTTKKTTEKTTKDTTKKTTTSATEPPVTTTPESVTSEEVTTPEESETTPEETLPPEETTEEELS